MPEENPYPNVSPLPDPTRYRPQGSMTQRKKYIGIGILVLIVIAVLVSQLRQKHSVTLKQTLPQAPAKHVTLAELQQSDTATQTPFHPATGMTQPPKEVPVYYQPPQQPTQEKTVKQQLDEQEKQLEYKSSFSSNMVERPNNNQTNTQPSTLSTVPPPQATLQPVIAEKHPSLPPPDGPMYTLPEGTIINCALVNELNGDFSGPVQAQVSSDVFAPGTRTILIPQGSKVLGETSKVSGFGQQRLAVKFHRLIIGDGAGLYAVALDTQAPGLDQSGATALKDKVNNHYASIFGASLAIGAIGGLAQIGNAGSYGTYSPNMEFRNGVTESMAQSSAQILNRFLNKMPTITIRPGTLIQVYLVGDLNVPAYQSAPTMSLEPAQSIAER